MYSLWTNWNNNNTNSFLEAVLSGSMVLVVDGDISDIFEEHYKQIGCHCLFINIQFCGTTSQVWGSDANF